MSVSEWIPDFGRRLAQLDNIAQLTDFSNVEVWLGGLFFPEAYITATRQAIAHRKRWSLETLNLRLDIESVRHAESFIIDGESSFVLMQMSIIIDAYPQRSDS
jgi:dynein heavy chain 1, cytosolic